MSVHCYRIACQALNQPVALLTEELRARIRAHADIQLRMLPQLTTVVLASLHAALMKQPNLGADIHGYEELMILARQIVKSAPNLSTR